MDESINNSDPSDFIIEVKHLNLDWNGAEFLPDLNFKVQIHKGFLITGPNENANIRLLKMMGGIIPPDLDNCNASAGIFLFHNNIFKGGEKEIKDAKKKMAFVFREGTLISNLDVKENLLLPIQFHFPGKDCSELIEKVMQDFHTLEIEDVLNQRPDHLTYVTKKKISFIRASLLEPEIIFLEKPMFNLDDQDKELVLLYLQKLKQKGITFVMVSRSQKVQDTLIDEAMILEKFKKPVFITKTHAGFKNLNRFNFHC